ncbi:hypothetical protein [Dasania marina]|uniref:hypothetical protein n=1 Tax=Dasania marina TaxID=471499 RepID=UPI00036C104B|nr:hypothetical protein [Dasania marina]
MKVTKVKLQACLMAVLLLTAGLMAQASLALPQPSALTHGVFVNQTIQVVNDAKHTHAANVATFEVTSHLSALQKVDAAHGLVAAFMGSEPIKPSGSVTAQGNSHSAATIALQRVAIAANGKPLGDSNDKNGFVFSANKGLSYSESLFNVSRNLPAHLFKSKGDALMVFALPAAAPAHHKRGYG